METFGRNGTLLIYQIILATFLSLFYSMECIEENNDCVRRIPRRSIQGNCSSELDCREIVEHGTNVGVTCGSHQECIVQEFPRGELCRNACSSTDCGRLCKDFYDAPQAMYCIEARDHPNALPPGIQVQPNKYFCICVAPNLFDDLK